MLHRTLRCGSGDHQRTEEDQDVSDDEEETRELFTCHRALKEKEAWPKRRVLRRVRKIYLSWKHLNWKALQKYRNTARCRPASLKRRREL